MTDTQFQELRDAISSVASDVQDIKKKLSFVEIDVKSIEKKVDKLMEWSLADQDGVDYSKKMTKVQ